MHGLLARFPGTAHGILAFVLFAGASMACSTVMAGPPPWPAALDRCDVVWSEPGTNSAGSMPLGNGDLGANVWVERDGDLMLLLSKSDAWSENAQLLKLGRIRVQVSPNPFLDGQAFRQHLHLAAGEIVIDAGTATDSVQLRLRVDAHHPALMLDLTSTSPRELRAELEPWRTTRRELTGTERHPVYGLYDAPGPVFSDPDRVLDAGPDRVAWHHRNDRSLWKENLRLQGLDELTGELADPLLNRTFGASVTGEGFRRTSLTRLESSSPRTRARLVVTALTKTTAAPDDWLTAMDATERRVRQADETEALANHRRWWSEFWNRSWIVVEGDAEAERVTRGYALQRFMQACAGRGAHPIKFNGSLFTAGTRHQGRDVDPDFRLWGGPYWFQNTRLPYWSMLAAGDYDLQEPLFRMYTDSLRLARFRTRKYYGHAGAFWPETMYFWGTYADDNYGRDRRGKPDGLTENRYIRYYWSGALELVLLMLDRYAYAPDPDFLQRALLPVADDVTLFFDEHWRRDERGRIRFAPAQSLETYHTAVNPAPEIAGLRAVLPRLLDLPTAVTTTSRRDRWKRMTGELPGLPLGERDGLRVLLPAAEFSEKANSENPELYAIFPYRLLGVGKPDLELARRTFEKRLHRGTGGWQQDAIQAAFLGLADEAARMVADNFSRTDPQCRFPAFWGPNFDWTPDQDHGAVAMIALQAMLLQPGEPEPALLPAWPRRWNVRFKLHAPGGTVVAGETRDGRFVPTPATR